MKNLFFSLLSVTAGLIAIAILAGGCFVIIPQIISPDHSRVDQDYCHPAKNITQDGTTTPDDKPFIPTPRN
jgi:hypothetical protein